MTPTLARALLAAAALASAASCDVLPEREMLNIYQLSPTSLSRSGAAPLPLSIRIETPDAGELTGGTRILVMRSDNQVNVYQSSRWIDPSAQLLRNRLVDAFRTDGRFRNVTTESSNVPVDLELRGELTTFQVEYENGRPSARIRFHAVLSSPKKATDMASRRFEVAHPVEGDKVPEVVQAFSRASDRLASEVIAWTAEEAARR